jgi:hypothetical protein
LIANWEVALDGFQVFLCCLILVFLVSNRRRSKLIDMKLPLNENAAEFYTEVMLQSIKQQADQIFDSILSSINREKQNLARLFEAIQVESRSKTVKFNLAEAAPSPLYSETRFTMGRHQSSADAHQMIETLAVQGIGAAEIASHLKVPLAEVEFLLKIKKDSATQPVEGTA